MKNNYSEKFEKMHKAGELASKTLDMVGGFVKPGISTNKIDQLCYEFIRDNGGFSAPLFYRGFSKSLCTSLNHVVCHGIPSDRILDEGDILNIDVTVILDGWYGDTSRMYYVDTPPIKSQRLTEVTYDCLMFGIEAAKLAGVPLEVINKARFILNSLEKKNNFKTEIKVD